MAAATSFPEKFAIVGIGCRMPPNASSLPAFWRFLLRGGNALKPIKSDRWDWRQYWDEDPSRPGKSYAPKGAFLDADVRQFDPLAFGMSPREAASLDPQQRLLLECVWEAFEDAGLPLERASGGPVGVFVGGFCPDHLLLQSQPSNRHLINAHAAGGVMMTVLSNRLSHAFNLRGPSLTLDTACSSSLVALHYACQSLRLGESDMVLAGGVNVMTRPEIPIIMSKGHFLSDHGECHAFDETASGYARGEGAAILLLKRYDDAVAAGDTIHAVVRATGVNQDGRTDGISLPNSEAQEELIERVYRESGVPVSEIDYVEAHGTGTQAGDSAELGALHRSFQKDRKRKLLVGSVKTNIGHLEAAAGVAGLLKVIGILKNRQIPKNLHFKKPNPKIPFADYCLEVAAETQTLPGADEKPVLYAGINSFGYGGTNAHALLESAPPVEARPAAASPQTMVVPISARSEKALRDLAGKVAFQLGQPGSVTLGDLAYSCAFRRSHLDFRAALVTDSVEKLREQLIALSTGEMHEGVALWAGSGTPERGLVFVYTGMGPQWWGMGQELMRSETLVAETIDEIDAIFQPMSGWSLKEAMLAPEAGSRMTHTEVAQPANFALQVALARLWASYGIRPAAVVGHSVGEVSAAYAAGVYSLKDAVTVSYQRSRLQQTLAGRGAMLAVGLPEAEASKLLEGREGVSIAAVNSFHAVTLSGDADELRELAADLETRDVFQKFLRVEVAYHSPQMDPIRQELLECLAGLQPQPSVLPLYSTVEGGLSSGERWDAEYWWQNVRQPVHFAAAVEKLLQEGYAHFLEVGPHPVLGNSLKECAAALDRKIVSFPSIRRAEPEKPRLLLSLGELYCAGHAPDWRQIAPESGKFVPAPQYPWQRQLCWNESERSRMERFGLPGPVYLNRTISGPDPGWEVEINRNYFPFLFDHRVQDQTVFAGMGYIEAALSLAARVFDKPAVVLENVSFERVLVVDYSVLQYLVTQFEPDAARFNVSSRVEGSEEPWQRHCTGRMFPLGNADAGLLELDGLREKCPTVVPAESFYERLRHRDLNYGPAFRPVQEMTLGENCFLARIDASPLLGETDHPLHPVLFDAALQAVIFCAGRDRLFVPSSFGQFAYYGRVETPVCYAYGEFIRRTESHLVANVWLLDETGRICVRSRQITLQFVDTKANLADANLAYALEWRPAPAGEATLDGGEDTVILADEEDSDLELARQLAGRLPGAKLCLRSAGGEGFGSAALAAELGANQTRVVVLWGSRAGNPAVGFRPGEKAVGLFQALGSRPTPTSVTFVTRGAQAVTEGERLSNPFAHALSALGLVAQNELENLICRSIDIGEAEAAQAVDEVIAELARKGPGDSAYRDGQRFVQVLDSWKEKEAATVSVSLDEPVELWQETKGRPDSLKFRRIERVAPQAGEVEIRVHRVALNYKDFLKVEGHISPLVLEDTFWGTDLGMECAGEVIRCGEGSRFSPGDKVMAILPRAFRSYATIPDFFVAPIPEPLDMNAAAVPVAYMTAYRGLVEMANLQPGERVLIHSATGGLGRAALDIARWIGAEIFATAGSEEKRRVLQELGVTHVFSSRDLDFVQQIRSATNQEGLDVVIGAQSGPFLHAGVNLLRTGGRYIEVGKKDIAEDHDLPLRAFNRNLAFLSLDIDRLAHERPATLRKTLDAVLQHFANGDFSQGEVTVLPAANLREAFADMARSRHTGKLVADFSSGTVDVAGRTGGATIASDGCYLVTGGTSGFGLTTAKWLAAQGAGRVVLASRSGERAPGIAEAAGQLRAQGCEVEIVAADIADAAQLPTLRQAIGPRPLRGIIHAAMVLDDALLKDLTEDRFRRVLAPKVEGARVVSELAAEAPQLDFLVFYSSISALVGNPGQANYIAANSILDAMALDLRAKGIPAISVNWGALAESGVVARDQRIGGVLASSGVTGLTDQQALEGLEKALSCGRAGLGVFAVDWKRWAEANSRLAEHPAFRDLRLKSQQGGAEDPASRLRQEFAGLTPDQRVRVLTERLQEIVAVTLRMAKDAIPLNRKLNEMGVDSLLVLELGLGIRERIGVSFSAMEFLKGPTLQQLAELADKKLFLDEI
jgi:acyl transferase domain-containing protein/NADPH:quinone reductase-like Zn-dependent oxidoreductase/acyl carrier protein